MSNTIQFILVVIALLIGSSIGAYVSFLFSKTKATTTDEASRQRIAEKDDQIKEIRELFDRENRTFTEERAAHTIKLDDLQRQLLEAREAKAQMIGAGESVAALKEQLETKSEEVDAYVQRVTKLTEDLSHFKKAAEEADKSKGDALAQKDVAVDRLIAAKDAAHQQQIQAANDACARQLADKDAHHEREMVSLREHCEGQVAEKAARLEEQKCLLIEAEKAKLDALALKDAEVERLISAKEAALKEQIDAANDACTRQIADKQTHHEREMSSLREHCEAQIMEMKTRVEEQRTMLADAEKKLTETFDSLSVKALKTVSEEFMRTAKATLETTQADASGDLKLKQQAFEELLKPFSETMKTLDKRCQESDEKAATAQALLKEQLDRLMGATDNLSSAFRKPNSRGSWGEKTLQNVFENSGLQEGHDYVLQHTTDAEDGKLRADAIVHLPKGRRLVIDAKNLWDGYQQAMSATEEPARQLLLQKHAQAVRNQVKLLSTKAYWQQYDGLDCVVMFLPTEAMFHAALEYDKELLNDAIANRVYLASPMTLIGLLRAVHYVLDQERLNKNAIEISEIGKKLYEAVRVFGTHYAKVGSNLRRTVDAYNESVGSLERNVLSKARQLRSKGVGATNVLEEPQGIESLPTQYRSRELTEAVVEIELPLPVVPEAELTNPN